MYGSRRVHTRKDGPTTIPVGSPNHTSSALARAQVPEGRHQCHKRTGCRQRGWRPFARAGSCVLADPVCSAGPPPSIAHTHTHTHSQMFGVRGARAYASPPPQLNERAARDHLPACCARPPTRHRRGTKLHTPTATGHARRAHRRARCRWPRQAGPALPNPFYAGSNGGKAFGSAAPWRGGGRRGAGGWGFPAQPQAPPTFLCVVLFGSSAA